MISCVPLQLRVIKLIKKGEHLNIYNIGTMDEVAIKDVATLVGKAFNKKINVIPGKIALGSISRRCPDISKIVQFGYNPKVSLEQGVKILVDWYKSHSHKEKKIKDEERKNE